MRILIVGATGLLLGKEVLRLLAPEHQVIGASRNGPDLSVDLADKSSGGRNACARRLARILNGRIAMSLNTIQTCARTP